MYSVAMVTTVATGYCIVQLLTRLLYTILTNLPLHLPIILKVSFCICNLTNK